MKWGVRKDYEKKGRKKTSKKQDKAEESKKKGLTDKQKTALKIGAAAVATGLAIYGGYKLSQAYKGKGQAIDPTTGFRMLNKDADPSDLNAINPGRIRWFMPLKNKEIIRGSSMNCMSCTTAYEMRQRGYDVRAGFSTKGYTTDIFSKVYSDYKGTAKVKPQMSDIENFIKNEGNGARGNIMVWWKQGGGHSMIWENVNGKAVLKDGQTGMVYKDFENMILRNANKSAPVELLRTDKLNINVPEMKKFVNPDTVLKTYVDHGADIAVSMALDPVVLTGAYTAYKVNQRRQDKQYAIEKYKKEHPNTELTDREIAKMIDH